MFTSVAIFTRENLKQTQRDRGKMNWEQLRADMLCKKEGFHNIEVSYIAKVDSIISELVDVTIYGNVYGVHGHASFGWIPNMENHQHDHDEVAFESKEDKNDEDKYDIDEESEEVDEDT
ncbi:hypothetical protein L2E82_10940 [Cichorium intybus]|uniref:Uncharacterized protein n=1 Tax=Cichorium intybus TaxID=13427 RepID=A0ACB9GCY6_CICIN|nr:hypothetical protein L2E82_10940 [Cichorium intybus]